MIGRHGRSVDACGSVKKSCRHTGCRVNACSR
uniref:Uncharacterized protein n=1 Tax=Siphoviridae sp. ctBLh2 TaxID=2827803 RepID=A0A8S5S3F9_9CAUD|nr:MAG TPA: hypothetical protein [Siphoviridae sp. ctBLh2]